LTGVIEKYGSGLTRIRRACSEAGTVIFSMEELPNGVRVTFLKKAGAERADKMADGGIIGGINGGINTVLKYIETNPGIKAVEIAADLKISQRTLERILKHFKDANRIQFRGARKTGGYYLSEFCDESVK
jgi:ATP-dependent DNA helicase RecG